MPACMPGDFERQSALLLGCGELLPYAPNLVIQLIDLLVDNIPLVVLVHDEAQRRLLITQLCDWNIPAHKIHFMAFPGGTSWVRDYGPIFVQNEGNVAILDADYLIKTDTPHDHIPTEIAKLLKVPVSRLPVALEGGNILSNGHGLCLSTQRALRKNAERGIAVGDVYKALNHCGFRECIFLEPLLSELTGHVDLFATFVSPNTVLVGSYDPKVDPVNAPILDRNARALEQLQPQCGKLNVVRIPMPTNHGSVFRSYTNVIFANGRIIMPTYGAIDRAGEGKAMELYRHLLPGWEVFGLDATRLIYSQGALRCMSAGIPWMDQKFAPIRKPIAA